MSIPCVDLVSGLQVPGGVCVGCVGCVGCGWWWWGVGVCMGACLCVRFALSDDHLWVC